MKRVGMVVVTMGAALLVLAMVGSWGSDASGEQRESRLQPATVGAVSVPIVERRRKARWTCTVRHARTQHDYRCTKSDETKSCRCAIAKCKHWNPGQPGHCSTACKCAKH